MNIRFTINGREAMVEALPDRRVVDLLREDLHLMGTKEGCGSGECGACTVLIDGEPRLSCLMLAAQLEGRTVTTIEGLANGDGLHPVQEAFVRCGAVQCGFCSPGMMLAASALLTQTPDPTRDQIREGLTGNLCRCTGYQKIVDAVETAARSTGRVADPGVSPAPSRLLHLSREGGVGSHEGKVAQGTEENSPDAPVGVTFRTRGARATQVFLPGHLGALWSRMAEHPEARVFAGGTDLLVQMRARREDAPVLIGLERIVELHGVRKTPSGLWIGAGNTHRRLLDDPRIRKDFPVLAQALRALGSPAIRNMGTIGGNLCTASPAGDALPPLYILGAELELSTRSRRRTVPIDTFITDPGKTVLRPGEILTGIRLNRPDGYEIHHYEKVGQRKALACTIASMAALLKISPTGEIEAARLAWGSVGPTVVTSAEVEAALIGERLSPTVLETAARLARQAVSPIDDLRASANYRRRVSGNLLLRLGTDLQKTFPSSGPFSQGSSPSS
jgi:xanthine dehydrogenase small subunit